MKILSREIKNIILATPQNEANLLSLKRKFAKNSGQLPLNSELLSVYRNLLKNNKIKTDKNLEKLLKKKNIRTLSGVAPISVLVKNFPCPGNCLYCPTEKAMPKSYLSNEPAVMRAVLCDFHPFKQVALRLKALQQNGHSTDKLELIVIGGTWNALPEKYRLWFMYNCFAAANEPQITINKKQIIISKNLKLKTLNKVTWKDLYREQKKNEMAQNRIIGLTLETRPDYITCSNALEMRQLGCTRVELGVQHLNDKILKLNRRGHGVAETIKATNILRSLGFKITYHLMLNLPGSNPAHDLAMFKKLFKDACFQPDQIKIYPCVVTKNSDLYNLWQKGQYQPYNTEQLTNLLIKIKKIVPEYVRIIRVIRDIPETSIIAGNKITNLRETVLQNMLLNNKPCRCIRCREVGHQQKTQMPNVKCKKIKLCTNKYEAGSGTEYFLNYESVDKKVLYAFLRLHLPTSKNQLLVTDCRLPAAGYWLLTTPIIRELHTYGELVPIDQQDKTASQHRGMGKKLILEAEKIACQNNFREIAVIAGIGVRNYYRKLGYTLLKDTYLVKKLRKKNNGGIVEMKKNI